MCFIFYDFFWGSIDLKGMQADNLCNVVPPTSRSTNSIALRFSDSSSGIPVSFTLLFTVIIQCCFRIWLKLNLYKKETTVVFKLKPYLFVSLLLCWFRIPNVFSLLDRRWTRGRV